MSKTIEFTQFLHLRLKHSHASDRCRGASATTSLEMLIGPLNILLQSSGCFQIFTDKNCFSLICCNIFTLVLFSGYYSVSKLVCTSSCNITLHVRYKKNKFKISPPVTIFGIVPFRQISFCLMPNHNHNFKPNPPAQP